MNKKGFMSTSLVFALLLVFVLMITLVLSLYSNNRNLLNKEIINLKEDLYKLNKEETLNIGDQVLYNNINYIIIENNNMNYKLLYNDIGLINNDIEEYLNNVNGYLLNEEEVNKYKMYITLDKFYVDVLGEVKVYNNGIMEYEEGINLIYLITTSDLSVGDKL